jgi:very-short-patch-repair endonuclease
MRRRLIGSRWVAFTRGATAEKRVRSVELRRDMTPAEKVLWCALRMRRRRVKFRRQHVIAGLSVDFYAPQIGLVIEVDGAVHHDQIAEDAARTTALEGLGLTVIRFRNDEVLDDLDRVIRLLDTTIEAMGATHSPSRP